MSVNTSTSTTTATTAMVSSCEHFFDIPELVEHLAQYLVRQDVSRLTRTNNPNPKGKTSIGIVYILIILA
ncbi:hypothetical protein BGZ89_006535 [Linnemannia elongata]|nr:hypothetical protein BGZ89_006535 [Linnemannia elongata]